MLGASPASSELAPKPLSAERQAGAELGPHPQMHQNHGVPRGVRTTASPMASAVMMGCLCNPIEVVSAICSPTSPPHGHKPTARNSDSLAGPKPQATQSAREVHGLGEALVQRQNHEAPCGSRAAPGDDRETPTHLQSRKCKGHSEAVRGGHGGWR